MPIDFSSICAELKSKIEKGMQIYGTMWRRAEQFKGRETEEFYSTLQFLRRQLLAYQYADPRLNERQQALRFYLLIKRIYEILDPELCANAKFYNPFFGKGSDWVECSLAHNIPKSYEEIDKKIRSFDHQCKAEWDTISEPTNPKFQSLARYVEIFFTPDNVLVESLIVSSRLDEPAIENSHNKHIECSLEKIKFANDARDGLLRILSDPDQQSGILRPATNLHFRAGKDLEVIEQEIKKLRKELITLLTACHTAGDKKHTVAEFVTPLDAQNFIYKSSKESLVYLVNLKNNTVSEFSDIENCIGVYRNESKLFHVVLDSESDRHWTIRAKSKGEHPQGHPEHTYASLTTPRQFNVEKLNPHYQSADQKKPGTDIYNPHYHSADQEETFDIFQLKLVTHGLLGDYPHDVPPPVVGRPPSLSGASGGASGGDHGSRFVPPPVVGRPPSPSGASGGASGGDHGSRFVPPPVVGRPPSPSGHASLSLVLEGSSSSFIPRCFHDFRVTAQGFILAKAGCQLLIAGLVGGEVKCRYLQFENSLFDYQFSSDGNLGVLFRAKEREHSKIFTTKLVPELLSTDLDVDYIPGELHETEVRPEHILAFNVSLYTPAEGGRRVLIIRNPHIKYTPIDMSQIRGRMRLVHVSSAHLYSQPTGYLLPECIFLAEEEFIKGKPVKVFGIGRKTFAVFQGATIRIMRFNKDVLPFVTTNPNGVDNINITCNGSIMGLFLNENRLFILHKSPTVEESQNEMKDNLSLSNILIDDKFVSKPK